jgi:hypothetical protein
MTVGNMELDVMERYVAFICEEIPEHRRVLLNPPPKMDNGELGYVRHAKIGPNVWEVVSIEIIAKYTRSAKFRLTFDKYVIEDIFYMSRHKGPDKLIEESCKKIDKLVNKAFTDDDRTEEIRSRYKLKSDNFGFSYNTILVEAETPNKVSSDYWTTNDDYLDSLKKKLDSKQYKETATPEEYENTKETYEKAKLRLKLLKP